ncbi:MAG: UDP-N-acetylmuramoyl-L-alanyl-D-glutamate--2,6-diaminopimelate ligase [Ignavibacteriales bacterium]|nr:UDP-N-acetylmuramoyl-L-alanyl-D-glutamate--2,6-diaminopimelate ligase [Ignavibacteriales bacterium]
MKLAQVLAGVPVAKMYQTMYGHMVTTHDVEVRCLQYDSRKVERGDCFIALRGATSDGHSFIDTAIGSGAKVVVMERETLPDSYFMHAGVVKVVVGDSRKALARMASNYFGDPSAKMTVVGVTGTNGKTTTSYIIQSVLECAGYSTGLIGTIEYRIGAQVLPATHTTPESLELHELFSDMREGGCTAVSMEVSSHALHQSRVEGIPFAAAVFTNFTQDHLDYHGTMEEYFKCKKMLFDNLDDNAAAVTNTDDANGERIVADTRCRIVRYGMNNGADVRGTIKALEITGSTVRIETHEATLDLRTQLVGRFNVQNALAAFAVGCGLGLEPKTITEGIEKQPPVRGRFEQVASPKGWTAIVDYAHTPDAMKNCLNTIREVMPKHRTGRIITVFGAGGDRDRTKRPEMGRIANALSDFAIVTSDNPRTEEAEKILDDIVEGIVPSSRVIRQVDRRKAIEQAVEMARAGDVIVVAGKGHEEYQVIGTQKHHFSDREVLESLIS